MKWYLEKEVKPNNERRVLVCLQYYLIGEPNGKKYHYWISTGIYCESRGWLIEVNPSIDPVIYWAELPDLPIDISNQPERSKREDSFECDIILKQLKDIFKDHRLLIDIKKDVKNLIEYYEMRCSEHGG